MDKARFLLTGDSSLSVEFGNVISEEINRQVRAFALALERENIPGIVETVPTYRSLAVHYDPMVLSCGELKARLSALLETEKELCVPPAEVLVIPVLYGGEEGPDLPFVAKYTGLSAEEVVKIHSSADYLIYMLGFTPGFTYLGGLDPVLETPRLATPRVRIPAGSVGIAGKQTGIYPIDSPGGWQLIGRTPVKLYDPARTVQVLPKAGQYIRFMAVDRTEYERIAAEVSAGTYVPAVLSGKEAEP